MRRIATLLGFVALLGFCPPGLPAEPADNGPIPSFEAAARSMPLPGTKRIYLHQPCDYKIVMARPDLKFQFNQATGENSSYRTGVGFVILNGDQPESFDFHKTRQQFEEGALPLLCQTVVQQGFVFQQTAFTSADASDRRVLMIRLRVSPEKAGSPRSVALAWLAVRQPHRRFHSHDNEDYIVFEPWAPAWHSGLKLRYEVGVQHDGQVIFDVIRATDNVTIAPTGILGGALAVKLTFDHAREAVIDVTVPYEGVQKPVSADDRGLAWRADKAFRLQDKPQLAALAFDAEFARQAARWKQQLDRAARIEVPEAVVGDVYRTLTLNDLQFLGSSPGVPYYKPGQGGYNNFSVVYGWESAHFLTIMDRQGFRDETRRVLDYFLTTQQGTHGPTGDISTAEGCFRPHIHWMCETGAILRIFAEHALAGGDVAGLRRDSPALLKAARWIQGQRARTKQLDLHGHKVLHYGLMPPGRASDWPDSGYFLMTDAFTWEGLDRLAAAYEAARLPDATWLRSEADEYRSAILEAVRRSLKPHPVDPSLQWVQNEIYENPALALATTTYNGPRALVGAGVVQPNDPLVPMIERSLRQAGCMDDRFAFRMRTMEDADLKRRQEASAGGKIDLYYVTDSERVWHRVWLERGERLKALGYFYMTLAYATSRDLHLSHERYCPQLPWLLPWQPNASGNGRILEMILNTLAFEQGDSLCLLCGAPDAWFAAAKPLGLAGIHTSWGTFSFRLTPDRKPGSFQFHYEMAGRVPARLIVAIPSAEGREKRRLIEIATDNRPSGTRIIP